MKRKNKAHCRIAGHEFSKWHSWQEIPKFINSEYENHRRCKRCRIIIGKLTKKAIGQVIRGCTCQNILYVKEEELK